LSPEQDALLDRLRRASRELEEAFRLSKSSKHPKSAEVTRGLQVILGLLDDSSRNVKKMAPVEKEPEKKRREPPKRK
jgi:soluble cytochrome b562